MTTCDLKLEFAFSISRTNEIRVSSYVILVTRQHSTGHLQTNVHIVVQDSYHASCKEPKIIVIICSASHDKEETTVRRDVYYSLCYNNETTA
jgi:hypothetical protein